MKMIRRTDVAKGTGLLYKLIAILCALAASGVIIAIIGYSPLEVYKEMITGAVMTPYRIQKTITYAVPLVTLSLGIAAAFKMRFWNRGAEGQFYMGAFGAAYIALNFSHLGAGFVLPAMLIMGALMGALWLLIPAFFKVKFGTNETLMTLMLNFIATLWVSYLQYGPWKDPQGNGFPIIARFDKTAQLPLVFGVQCGWILALILVGAMYLLLGKSKLGYEITVIGENETTARYAGMNVWKTVIIASMISGALCGLTGAMQASAVEKSLSDKMSGGIGFTAIITAYLAKLDPVKIVFSSLFFAVLIQGGNYLQSAMEIPAAVSEVIQGFVLLFVLGGEFFMDYKLVSAKTLERKAESI